jgi:hypothetical protein
MYITLLYLLCCDTACLNVHFVPCDMWDIQQSTKMMVKCFLNFLKNLFEIKLLSIVICTLLKTLCADDRKSKALMLYSSHEPK